MIAHALAEPTPRAKSAAVMPAGASPEPRQAVRELSIQTQWMVAVRDQKDKSAFGKLFDYFAPRLKGMAMRVGSTASQAEDIVQEVMLTVWRKAHLFDPARAQVSAWVYQIARNKQIDLVRKNSRPIPEELAQPQEAEVDASEVVNFDQEVDRLRAAMKNLSDEQREMLERAYMGELSHQEINQETGLPLGTIKSRIRLALQRLRYELADLR